MTEQPDYFHCRALVRGLMELAGAMSGGRTVKARTDPQLYFDIERLAWEGADRAGDALNGDLREALRAVQWQAAAVWDAIEEAGGDEDELPAASILAIDTLTAAAWELVADTEVGAEWEARLAPRRTVSEKPEPAHSPGADPAAVRRLREMWNAEDQLQAGRFELRARTRALLALAIAMDDDPGLTTGVNEEADAGALAAERATAMRDLSTEAGAIADAIAALASEHPELRAIAEDVPEYLKSAAALAEAALDQSTLVTPTHRPQRLHFVEAAIRDNLESAWGAANFDGRSWTGDDA